MSERVDGEKALDWRRLLRACWPQSSFDDDGIVVLERDREAERNLVDETT